MENRIKELMTYEDVINKLNKAKREKHLLLGNGFSRAFDDKIFSYNALSDFIIKIKNPLLQKLFSIINTRNFEQIMAQLDNFIELADNFGNDKELVKKFKEANTSLKKGLIEAVESLHPEHVFKISDEQNKSCAAFLNEYLANNGKIFSTNYDLLLYWVTMRNNFKDAVDGFGREVLNYEKGMKPEDYDWSELRWGKYKDSQAIYYLHGALQIFDTGIEIIKEEYDSERYLLTKIRRRMEKKDYPVFVTAGNGEEKLNHIMHNKYLSHCFEELTELTGSLITFGFNFGEYDTHIIDAINKAHIYREKVKSRLYSVYIGVYSDEGLKHIEKIETQFKCKVNKYNARTVSIW